MGFLTLGMTVAGFFGKTNISEKAAKAISWGVLVLALVIAAIVALSIHDRRVGRDALDKRDVKISREVVEAGRVANAEQDKRNDVFREEQTNIAAATLEAVRADPVETRKPIGPASKAYYDALRRQQAEQKRKSK